MTSQQQNENWRQTGRDGGHVDTNGMSSSEKQAADRAVKDGRRETNR